jgi:adenosine deaminase
MPKVDLHRHLEGSLRLATLAELVRQEGLDLPGSEPELRPLVQVQPGEPRSPARFLEKFTPLRDFYRSPEILQRFVDEVLEDAAKENVRYLELRFTPLTLASTRGFPLGEVADWIIEAAARSADRHNVGLGLIVSINRHDPVHLAEQVVRMAVDRAGAGIVGVGLAGDEVHFPAEPFVRLFEEARAAGLRTTVHAGEWTGAATVRHALEKMRVTRIGHGGRVMEDPEVVALALEKGAVFEICLSSNLHSGVISDLGGHPLPEMIQAGLSVTLNSDDPGVSNVTLAQEYGLAVKTLGLSLTTLVATVLTAAQAAFLDQRRRDALETELAEAFFGHEGWEA